MGDMMACPVCNARVSPGAAQCVRCRSSLAGLAGSTSAAARPGASPPSLGGPTGFARLPLGAPPSPARPAPPLPPRPPPTPRAPGPPARPAPQPDDELATADDVTHQRVSIERGAVLRERYEVRHALGDGVLGSSWAARDTRSGVDVVLKVVADMLVTNERERADLVGKLEMFAGRTLPGVVMPREVFAVPGAAVLVYPFVDAVSLRAIIDARRAKGERFTPEECLRVVQSLTAAVQAMHTASPHGALWPQNVLITARGLLLIDGFVAVSVAPERLAARVEHHPRSSPFASPELLGGRRPTASADLYALGAIVADLAGGAPPGEGPDLASVSRDLHRAASMLLDREPARRPAGVRALLDALSEAAGFAERPSEAPLTVPESVLLTPDASVALQVAPSIDPPTLPAPSPQAPSVPTPIAPIAAAPAAPAAPGPPGRLRGPTATLPANGARPIGGAVSGPPPSMLVKSGPPPAKAIAAPVVPAVAPLAPTPSSPVDARNFPKTLPSINQAISDAAKAARERVAPLRPQSVVAPPVRPPAPPPRPPAPPQRPSMPALRPPAAAPQPAPSRTPPDRSLSDDDEIDPKLLRAARMLDDERRRDR